MKARNMMPKKPAKRDRHGTEAVHMMLIKRAAAEAWITGLTVAVTVLYKHGNWRKYQRRRKPLEDFVECYKDYLDAYDCNDPERKAECQRLLDQMISETRMQFKRDPGRVKSGVKYIGASGDNTMLRIGALALYTICDWNTEELKDFADLYWQMLDGYRKADPKVMAAIKEMKQSTGMKFCLE